MAGLIDKIIEEKAETISVIGLAKNTGKTVTFNTIIKECVEKGIKPALVSFGRDGEAIDAITLLDKPRIIVPPNTYFVTAEKFINPATIKIKEEISTGLFTVFGETKVYSTGSQGGMVELIGINTLKNLSIVLPILKQRSDIVLVDGALDRRSSAVPAHSDATIMATGAVLGMTEDDVIKKTDEAIARFRIPKLKEENIVNTAMELFDDGFSGCRTKDAAIIKHRYNIDAIKEAVKNLEVEYLFVSGAITDDRMKLLSNAAQERKIKTIIKDGTRVFLDKKYLDRIKNGEIEIRVLNTIKILAVTVNPTRPFFANMKSEELVGRIRQLYPEYFCYNILSDEYETVRGDV